MIGFLAGLLVLGLAQTSVLAAESMDDERFPINSHPAYLAASFETPPLFSNELRLRLSVGRVLAARFQVEAGIGAGIPLGWGADLRFRFILPSIAVPRIGRLFFVGGVGPSLNLLGGFLAFDPAHEPSEIVDPSHVFHVLSVTPEVGAELRVPFQQRGQVSGVFRIVLGLPIVVDHDVRGLCRVPGTDESPCAFSILPNASAIADRGWWIYLRQTVGLAW